MTQQNTPYSADPMHTSKTVNKTCFFGTRGQFSAAVFSALLDHGAPITQVFCASVAPASLPKAHLPVSNPSDGETLDSLAHRHGIPIRYIASQSELSSLDLQNFEIPDFVLVACFPYRLPEVVISWPESRCLNIHPSLLPKYRGPDPIFWQLHENEPQTGVSLHIVSAELDAGPIISQKTCPFEEGSVRHEIETLLARSGAILFTSFIAADNTQNFTDTKQDGALASYYPFPSTDDYQISSLWSAKHAFNFIHGTCSPSGYYIVKSENETHNIISALEYSNSDNIIDKVNELNNELFIQFSPGILHATIE